MASFDTTLRNYLHRSDVVDYRNESVTSENAVFDEVIGVFIWDLKIIHGLLLWFVIENWCTQYLLFQSSCNSEGLLSTSEILKLDSNASQLSVDESQKSFVFSDSWIDRNECTSLTPIQELSFEPFDIERCSDDDVREDVVLL